MKRIIREILLFILFIIPINTNGLENSTTLYTWITKENSLEVGSLKFSDISFENFNIKDITAIGLSGNITNTSNTSINYTLTTYLYDINHILLAEWSSTEVANRGNNTFNALEESTILNDYNVDDIKYYRFKVSTDEVIDTSSIYGDYTPSKMYEYNYKDYVIDKYNVNIVINKDNTFDITEIITAYFNESKHGIIRSIPLKNTINRLDGSSSENRAKISNISVNKNYSTYKEDNNLYIKIGNEEKYVDGYQEYIIKYTYNIGKDPLKDKDELYFNIIGSEWDAPIGNVTFTVTMPDDFDKTKLGFSAGTVGSTNSTNIKYNVSGNVISGSYNGILDEEALTIRCELPEGYFVNAGFDVNPLVYIAYLLPLIFLIYTIFNYYKYGKDSKVVDTVEFYPPEGLNSLDVGFLYKGKANNKDVISLLIYLANKGYIKITETESKLVFSSVKGFKITKLKEYDGNNKNEEIFLRGLFSDVNTSFYDILVDRKEEHYDRNTVTDSDLSGNFAKTVNKILRNVNSSANKARVIDSKSTKHNKLIIALILLSYAIVSLPSILEFGDFDSLFSIALLLAFGTFFIYILMNNNSNTNNSIGSIIITIFALSTVFVLPLIIIVVETLEDTLYIYGYIFGMISIIGMVICLFILPRRTEYGNEMLGRLRGFKRFLETCKKDELESLVTKDPEYFYNILPFTYVLGVSNKWISKFESISITAPSWLESTGTFDISTISTFMSSSMNKALSGVNTGSTGSGGSIGSSSSGGGSSGGGSGGGGGSSW